MQVIRAKTAGFCMGVGLALRKLDESLQEIPSGKRLLMYGPIIHNPQVLNFYSSQGVLCIEDPKDILSGDILVIRAHGIPKDEEIRLNSLGVKIIDATCPKVKRAQVSIAKATSGGRPLYLFGEEHHPEVQGLISYAAGACRVFDNVENLEIPKNITSFVLAAQTTQEKSAFENLCKKVQAEGRDVTILSTICDATRKRQEEALAIADQVQVMIIVGGRTSGNTRRLADVVRSRGIPALHIETPAELVQDIISLQKYEIAGITAGASTPKQLIDEVYQLLLEIS